MKLYTFLYIISNLLILQLISLEAAMVDMSLNFLCGFGIITVGIAHGSLDNILYGVKTSKSNKIFILIYILLILAFMGLWVISVGVAFVIFMMISAYHFGQSQFEEYKLTTPSLSKILYFCWGCVVLFMPLAFNKAELLLIETQINDFVPALNVLISYATPIIFSLASVLLIVFSIVAYINRISISSLFKEIYIFSLIIVSFKLLPPFIAFSLFFVFIHSLKVMIQEYEFCLRTSKVSSIFHFVKLCLPLTLVSILGIALIVSVLYQMDSTKYIPLALVMSLSCITFPHALVMEKFYASTD